MYHDGTYSLKPSRTSRKLQEKSAGAVKFESFLCHSFPSQRGFLKNL